jgi:GT2 family glycosyltransferase
MARPAPGRALEDELAAWGTVGGPSARAVVVAGGDEGDVPEQALVDLLCGPLGIGAVVPLLFDAHGRVAEAGTFTALAGAPGAQTSAPFDTGAPLPAPEHSFRRDVPGTASAVVAVSRDALDGFPLGAGRPDARALVRDLIEHVRTRGLRVVYEPSWRVPAPEGFSPLPAPAGPRRWAERDEAMPTRALVVTGTIPGTLVGPEGLIEIVEALAQSPGVRVTLACADGFEAHTLAGYYQRQGVEVVTGPVDWSLWCEDRRYHYSHVFVSDEGLTTRLWSLVRATQPQALCVLYSERLPFRRAQALGQASWRAEGTETVAQVWHTRLLRQLQGVDNAWCANGADASLLAGLVPALAVTRIGPAVPNQEVVKGFADREGVALVATDNFDAAGDVEEPVLRALEELVPSWRRRDLNLRVRVISDWPTPGLALAASRAGAEVVPSGGDLVSALGTARLVVGPIGHGTSASSWVPAALAAGTPWLVTAKGLEGTDLGQLEAAAVPDVPTMAYQGWPLLSDETAWNEEAALLGRQVSELVANRRAMLRTSLTSAGIDPPEGPLWPVERWQAHPARQQVKVALRPPSVADPPAIFVPDSLTEDERYELWHERRGPTPDVVAAIAAEAAQASYQPKISVLMPVCDTEPWMLEAAVESVLAQPYPNWQLCMADDASRRPETLATIEALARRDGRVTTTRLSKRSGISAATNAALSLATGDYVAFLDHDDVLKPQALGQVVRWLDADPTLDMLYSDEDKLDPAGRLTDARWKPDWSPNLLLCQNYVCHLLVLRRSLVEKLGGLRSDFDGSQDYDLVLRVADVTDRIAHLPDSLYSWRQHAQSAAAAGEHKPWAWLAAHRALDDWLRRREDSGGTGGWTEEGAWEDVHRVRFRRYGEPKVSIIIPTRNGRHLLEPCIESLVRQTVYDNFEIVVVDNQTDDLETLEFLGALPGQVLRYPHEFNYPRQLNMAAAAVECDLLVFLNNDTEVMTADWLDRLIEQAMRPEVGAVGPRLRFPNGDIQHEGIVIGAWRGHANSIEWGQWWRMGDLLRDATAVTGACMATRPGVFWRVGGYDERLRVAYNDVDFCLRLHQAGYQVVFEPDAELYHAEGSTRGLVEDPEDAPLFNERWRPRSSCDPYYNPNLNRNRLLFRTEP